jgi:hypothetical protein
MRLTLSILIGCAAIGCLLSSHGAAKEGTEPVTAPPVDPAPCFAAVEARDDDKVIAICGPLIDGEKTARADRLKALIARAGAFDRKDQIAPSAMTTPRCCSIRPWPISSMPAANSGAEKATAGGRWPISPRRSN